MLHLIFFHYAVRQIASITVNLLLICSPVRIFLPHCLQTEWYPSASYTFQTIKIDFPVVYPYATVPTVIPCEALFCYRILFSTNTYIEGEMPQVCLTAQVDWSALAQRLVGVTATHRRQRLVFNCYILTRRNHGWKVPKSETLWCCCPFGYEWVIDRPWSNALGGHNGARIVPYEYSPVTICERKESCYIL